MQSDRAIRAFEYERTSSRCGRLRYVELHARGRSTVQAIECLDATEDFDG